MIHVAHLEMIECLSCKNTIELRIYGLSSGLGPPLVACGKCGAAALSGRSEWCAFRRRDVVWFIAYSIAAITAFAGFGGIVGALSYPAPGVPWGDRRVEPNPGFWTGICIFALLSAALQVHRVVASRRRTANGSIAVFRPSWQDLQTNMQIKAVVFALGSGVLGGVTSYLLFP